MMNVFKDNKKLNIIANEFYKKAADEHLEEIDTYLNDIEGNIFVDFDIIRSICDKKNKKLSFELFKLYSENLFYKTVDREDKIKYLQQQQNDYYTNFVSNFNDIEMILIHSLKQFYKIVKEVGESEELREIYAIYQTVGSYIINMLPEYYKQEFINNEMYEDLNCVNFDIENASNRYIINIDYILRDYIKEKYNVDLFEYSYSEQRKKIMRKKN